MRKTRPDRARAPRLCSELLGDPHMREKFTRDLDEMESMVGATLDFLRGQESGERVQPVDVVALLCCCEARAYADTLRLSIMPPSSCSRLWQWTM